MKRIINVPNTLSIFRIILIPVFCAAFLSGEKNYMIAGAALFLSAISDVFDGILARKLGQETELGKWLDPIGDKLTLGAVVACMWLKLHGSLPVVTPLFAFLIVKELIMAVGGYFVTRGRDKMIPAQWWGKLGTVTFYTCMIMIVIVSWLHIGGDKQYLIITLLVALPTAAMLFALTRYVIFAIKLLREDKKKSAPMTGTVITDPAKTAD